VSKPPRPRAQAPASAAGGIGRGGAGADANYDGRIAAHLARHKRFPSDARRRGARGRAGIDFSIDGRGRVTIVRIARSSGHASLDRAAEAMVWRASPFPAPPDGRPRRFSVPVSYSVR
jgi:protein TonB